MKKILVIAVVLTLMIMFASTALAEGSTIYDLCVAEHGAHKTAAHYSGVRIDKVPNGKRTLIKYTSITSDAGFVSKILKSAGLIDRVKTRAELKAMSTITTAISDGTLLVKASSTGAVSLVGIYAGGYQFYVMSGYVVMETYRATAWSNTRYISASPPLKIPFFIKPALSR